MTVIDPTSIFEELVPSVYISRILLEASGETLLVDNPHIDSSKEKLSLIKQKNKSDKSLKATINIVVKEKITNDNIATWFDKSDLTKYIDIKIFQSTDANLTELISSGIDMIDLIDPDKSIKSDDLRYIYTAYVYQINDLELLNSKLTRHSSVKKLNLNKGKNLLNSVDEFKSYIDDAGNQIYDITYVCNFIIPEEYPQHLAYFAVSSFNIEELNKDYKLKIDSSNLEKLSKKITSDIVIDAYEVIGKSYIFYDKDGKIWAGSTIQSENGDWYSGFEITENSKLLTRSVVNNSKVQDNRNFKKFTANINSLYNKFINNNITKILSNDNTVSLRKEKYFSDLMLARGPNGDSKFVFAINIDKLINEKSIYGNLSRVSRKLRDEVIKNSTIKNLSIYRIRVKQDGSGYKPFDQNEPVEYICTSRDAISNNFIKINNNRAALRESFILTNSDKQYLRYFTGIDKTMSDVTTGIYRYYVELELEDGTVDYVQKQIQLLSLAKVELEKYYEIATIPGTSKIKLEIENPHIQHSLESPSSKQYKSNYYDSISNQFTQEFEKDMKKRYPTNKLLLAPWISSLSVYVSVLDIFTDFLDNPVQRQKYLKDLHAAVSPTTGNPQGIMIVIGLINNLMNLLSKSVGITTTVAPRKFANSSQKTASFSRSARETIKITKIFNEVFDSEVVKDFAYDYLSLGEDDTKNDDGVRVINGEDFNERIAAETLKNFNSPADSLNINFAQNNILINDAVENTSFTYVTPTRIDTPRKSYILSQISKRTPPLVTIKEQKIKEQDVVKNIKPQTTSVIDMLSQNQTIFKPTRPIRERITENINENPESKENKLFKLKSEIIYSSIMGISNLSPKKEIELKQVNVSNKNLKVKEEAKNVEQITNNYDKILSTQSSALFEKNLIRKRSPPRVLKSTPPQQIKKAKLNLPVKDKVEKNIGKDIVKNNPLNLFNALVSPDASVKKINIKSIKPIDLSKPANVQVPQSIYKNNILDQTTDIKSSRGGASYLERPLTSNINKSDVTKKTILDIKSTELKASKDFSDRTIIEGFKKPITEEKFKELPNHVKKIFVKNEKAPSAPVLSTAPKPSEEFDYSLLNKIEYLEGFDTNEFGDIILSEPIWNKLTKSIYKSKIGKELLCRLRKYEDSNIGLQKIQALEKPIYDEFFILLPETINEELFQVKPIKIEEAKVTQEIIKNVETAIPGIKFIEILPAQTIAQQPQADIIPQQDVIRNRPSREREAAAREQLKKKIFDTSTVPTTSLFEQITGVQTGRDRTTSDVVIKETTAPVFIPQSGPKIGTISLTTDASISTIKTTIDNIKPISPVTTPLNSLSPITISPTDLTNTNISRISITETNFIGEEIKRNFQPIEQSGILSAVNSLPQNASIAINNQNVQIPIRAASEIVALETQTNFIKTEITSNNQVSPAKIADQIKKELNPTPNIAIVDVKNIPVPVSDKPLSVAANTSANSQGAINLNQPAKTGEQELQIKSGNLSIADNKIPQKVEANIQSTSSPIAAAPQNPISGKNTNKSTTPGKSVKGK